MSPEVIAILGVGVSLAALVVSGQRTNRTEFAAIRQELHALGERVARIEGALPFLVDRAKTSEPVR